ncbi:hypothetical protein B296_00042632 [Ensete ventricosum]|uniref:Uncharacterized protein n=1 Tax=Ensete ventricosum TaxID=4639 RepID=A0A426YRU5_ENSVE|nr:hypothetical protein B296_00042632 [Ensete ventricosum]
MGRVSYEFGYKIALTRFRTKHLGLEVEEDPYATLSEDNDVPMDVEVPFDGREAKEALGKTATFGQGPSWFPRADLGTSRRGAFVVLVLSRHQRLGDLVLVGALEHRRDNRRRSLDQGPEKPRWSYAH